MVSKSTPKEAALCSQEAIQFSPSKGPLHFPRREGRSIEWLFPGRFSSIINGN